ncbi:MAG TPA: universal stress protein [Malonomonas sp.]
MPIKEILIHLDNIDSCQTRLDVAISLSLNHQAHLTGVYATSHPFSAAPRADAPSQVAEVEACFRQKTAAAQMTAGWFCADAAGLHAGVSERLLLQAYYADLIIVGQGGQSAKSLNSPADLPERLVLGAGRPVLVIPNSGEFKTVGEKILLAWRGGQASSSALNNAIPFLELAQQVNVLMVNPGEHFEKQAANLSTYLGYHGVAATIDRLSADDVRAGDILLNQACDLEIDLVVLGVHAGRRMGKTVLGPVGKHFLEHMTIPVLMSR